MDWRDELPYLLSSPRFWSNGFLIGGGRRHLTYKVGAGSEVDRDPFAYFSLEMTQLARPSTNCFQARE